MSLPCGIFFRYQMLNFFNHPGNNSPLWNLIIIIVYYYCYYYFIIIIAAVIIIFIIIAMYLFTFIYLQWQIQSIVKYLDGEFVKIVNSLGCWLFLQNIVWDAWLGSEYTCNLFILSYLSFIYHCLFFHFFFIYQRLCVFQECIY